ncbi:hypothetical protein ADK35_22425 [Streptomyces viridochromogenes]|nr:hypothetical protein ADK36_25570 [Streptomyces viridochromogenes]KOG18207.1 hypothetical protein ADK35_22425 [Streptomyces viridochromogenes]
MNRALKQPEPADTPVTSRGQMLKALSGLLLALFVSTLSSTIVSTALPEMIRAVHGSRDQYAWVVHRHAPHHDGHYSDLGQAGRPLQQEDPRTA